MKSYLYATVAIAGVFTLAGTAVIAKTELGLVRTGQTVASIFMPGNRTEVNFLQAGAPNDRQDVASRLASEIDAHRLPEIRSQGASIAPVVDVKISTIPSTNH